MLKWFMIILRGVHDHVKRNPDYVQRVYAKGPIWPVLFETFAKNWFIRWKWSPLKRIAAKMRTYPA